MDIVNILDNNWRKIMTELYEFEIDGTDQTVVIEVATLDGEYEGEVEASRASDVIRKATKSLQEVLNPIEPLAQAVVAKVQSMGSKPDEVTIQFGVKISATAGALITSSTLDANFQIKLKWKFE